MSQARTCNRTAFPLWVLVFFLIVLFDKLYFLAKSNTIQGFSGRLHSQLFFLTTFEDASIVMLVIALSVMFGSRLRYPSVFLVLILSIFYLIDSVTMQSLYTRFTLPTIYTYRKELPSMLTFFTIKKALLFIGFTLFLWILRKRQVTLPIRRGYLIGILIFVAATPWIVPHNRSASPIVDMASLNILRINQQVVFHRRLNDTLLSLTKTSFPKISQGISIPSMAEDLPACTYKNKKSIIILISESLSCVDSMRCGKLFDRLPHIDKIQSQGLTLTNVISDGANTSDALAALLLGVNPLPTNLFSNDMIARYPVSSFDERDLVSHAKKEGYKTLALTNVALFGFQQNHEWLEALGFDYIKDGSSEIFKDYPHFTFNSPSDEVLYSKALSIIEQQNGPFLLLMLTVSLHKPYILPASDYAITPDPFLNQMNYIDRTTYDFYRNLYRRGFFKNGVLVLVGDHRRMDPLEPEEIEVKGIDAYGRIVTTMVGAGINEGHISDTPLNQTDINTILHHIVKGCDLASDDNFLIYNKYHFLGIDKPFTTHVINDTLGLVLVRVSGERSQVVKLHGNINPVTFSKNPVINEIVAYLALTTASLDDKQSKFMHR